MSESHKCIHMKRIILFLTTLSILSGACSRMEDMVQDRQTEVVELTVTASLGDYPQTRTTLQPADENGHRAIWWTPRDAINLFYGSMNGGKFTTAISEPQAVATFNGTLGAATGSSEEGMGAQTFWGVYPYNESNTCNGTSVTLTIPSTQLGVPDTFADKLNPTVANSSGLGLSFFNVGSWFVFSVMEEGITSATFHGNHGEDIAGRVQVSMDADKKPVAAVLDGVKSITIVPAEGGAFVPGNEYRIVLIPQTLANGYTISLRKGTKTAECIVVKSAEFKRSSYRRKLNADKDLEFVESYVDMGNGYLWSTRNVGAGNPEDYGNYYAWGETSPKDTYNWSTYAWGSGASSLTKYVLSSSYGTVDNKSVLEPEDDAATVVNGNSLWRTPTYDEWTWLKNNCSWTWTTRNEVNGYLVTSNVTGGEIFLPAAGVYNSSNLVNVGTVGRYWSSQISSNYSRFARTMHLNSSVHEIQLPDRYYGYSVRPIMAIVPVTGVSLDKSVLTLAAGAAYSLNCTLEPSNSSMQDVVWLSSDETVATVSPTGVVTAVRAGAATVIATSVEGGYSATCEITVLASSQINGHEYVEMGDGLKWATMNVGATSYTDRIYFAWGETESKSEYSWGNYKFMVSGLSNGKYVTKYQRDDNLEGAIWYDSEGNFTGDGLTVLELEDDPARQVWGGSWRTPTREEWKWLLDHCNWSEATIDGVRGFMAVSTVSGYVGNNIFFPFTHYSNITGGYSNAGRYWTSSLSDDGFASSYAKYMYFSYSINNTSGEITVTAPQLNSNYRYYGYSVRAVSE